MRRVSKYVTTKNKWKNALKGKKGQKTVRHMKDTKMAI